MPVNRVTELSAMVRSGEPGADSGGKARELLDVLTSPLDLEAAGAVLLGARAHDWLAAGGGLTQTRIALLGSSNLASLPAMVTAAAVRRRLLPDIAVTGYNQWRLEIAAGAPALSAALSGARPRITACLLDDEAVFAGVADPADVDQLVARCESFPAELAAWASSCQETLGGLTVLSTIPLSPLRRRRLIGFAARSRLDAAWLRMNAVIADLAARPPTVVLDASDLSASAGETFADDRMRHVASHVYAPGFLWAYAEELTRVAVADLGRAAKCLVLDLDDTLWGGLVGEEGLGGLRMSGGYPGSAHAELQALARDLAAQGVILAVCSKNDEAVAAEAIGGHPDMVLRPDSFATTRINWDPKPGNVRDIAAELNIGPDAMVFLDDSPLERDLMRQLAPEVTTVEPSGGPAGYASLLVGRGDFAVLKVTAEDSERTALYRAQAQRRQLRRSAASLEGYLVSLESRLGIEPRGPLNADRIIQLFGKTNQFNLTGIRYSHDDVTRQEADGAVGGAHFFAARLADRLGDNGLIAAVAVGHSADGTWDIGNMVMSCRVFGRGVEDAIVGLVLRRAADLGVPAVTGRFQQTAKNAQFAGFYPRLGFQQTADETAGGEYRDYREYRHDLGAADVPPPVPWIEIIDSPEVLRVP